MRRLLLLLFVGYLSASTAGALELVTAEPCSAFESASADGACAATCLRCHCARAFDVSRPPLVIALSRVRLDWFAPDQTTPVPAPAEILHVPRAA